MQQREDQERKERRFADHQRHRFETDIGQFAQSRLGAECRHRRDQTPARHVGAERGHGSRDGIKTVQRDEGHENDGETGQKRWPLCAGLGSLSAVANHGHDDHRQQHSHAQQLDDGRDIASFGRHAVAGADDLRDVVNGRAEKYARLS